LEQRQPLVCDALAVGHAQHQPHAATLYFEQTLQALRIFEFLLVDFEQHVARSAPNEQRIVQRQIDRCQHHQTMRKTRRTFGNEPAQHAVQKVGQGQRRRIKVGT
jgi:hypothetical protein